MSKMRIRLKIDAQTEFDGGYYREMSPAEIEAAIQRNISTMTIFVQEGVAAPRQLPSKIRLQSITYEVDDE